MRLLPCLLNRRLYYRFAYRPISTGLLNLPACWMACWMACCMACCMAWPWPGCGLAVAPLIIYLGAGLLLRRPNRPA